MTDETTPRPTRYLHGSRPDGAHCWQPFTTQAQLRHWRETLIPACPDDTRWEISRVNRPRYQEETTMNPRHPFEPDPHVPRECRHCGTHEETHTAALVEESVGTLAVRRPDGSYVGGFVFRAHALEEATR